MCARPPLELLGTGCVAAAESLCDLGADILVSACQLDECNEQSRFQMRFEQRLGRVWDMGGRQTCETSRGGSRPLKGNPGIMSVELTHFGLEAAQRAQF